MTEKTGWDITDEELWHSMAGKTYKEIATNTRALFPRPKVAQDAAHVIRLTPAEVQSGHDRVKWAEGLIQQLPATHNGRNSWLLNHGVSMEADGIRERYAVMTSKTPPKPNGPEIIAPPRPEPRQDVPSVTKILHEMRNGEVSDRFPALSNDIIHAHVARDMMLELAQRKRMLIDGMSVEEIRRKMRETIAGGDLYEKCAAVVHHLATTSAPVDDPDAEAKRLSLLWQSGAKIPLSGPWDTMPEDQRNGWRAVAAAQKKEQADA